MRRGPSRQIQWLLPTALLGIMMNISSGWALTMESLIRITEYDALFREGSRQYIGPDFD